MGFTESNLSRKKCDFFSEIASDIEQGGTLTELFLSRSMSLRPYSVRNIGLILHQSNWVATEVRGADEWKANGAKVLTGARPLEIFAPVKKNGKMEFIKTQVYDVSMTTVSARSQRLFGESLDGQLAFLNAVAQGIGWKLAYTTFKPSYTKLTYADWRTQVIYISNSAKKSLQVLMAAKELIVLMQQEAIRTGDRVAQSYELANSIAIASAFELCAYWGDKPPKLPMQAKKALADDLENNLKDIHRLSCALQKKIKEVLQNFKKTKIAKTA